MVNIGEPSGASRRAFLGATAAGLLAAKTSASAPKDRFPWRILELWHNPDGGHWWTRHGNILTWDAMLNAQPSSMLGRYVSQVREWGFNAMAFELNPENNLKAMSSFASYLRNNGIRMVLRRAWPEMGLAAVPVPQAARSEPGFVRRLCPYQPEGRAYWTRRVNRDFETIPALGGFMIHTHARGGPWVCDCSECQKKSSRERTLDAIRFMSGLLEKHRAPLFWRICQDDPWLMRVEADIGNDLTGKLPTNALVVVVDRYWDFHPGWPLHSVLESFRPDAQGKSPYITNIQSPGEYRGMHEFPWPMVDEWSQTFRHMAKTGQQGAWVVTEVQPEVWDHPLNMVNWHAISRLMRDPLADPASIKLEWARERFGNKAAPALPEIVDKVTEAARGMYEFDALWNHRHCRFAGLEYLDCHMCGPYRELKRIKGMMGMDLPLDMYPPRRAAEIKADPRTRMVFNRVPITPQLKAEAMTQKQRAVQLMEQVIKQWDGLKGAVASKEHDSIAAGLQGNRADTIIFRNMMDIYMDWKLGVLTESKIDAVLGASRGLRGAIVPDALADVTLDATPPGSLDRRPPTLASFAGQLRQDLLSPWVEDYWKNHPRGVS